ncbi:MAG: LacI family DNA-binding transcriptional regulator [Bacteroidales bacterium]|nr:LacI family DNA-binding transcriptional regulator [Bacteroidales bacterium]MDD4712988.1 LacI family DNA-binding transcriptional regulator [Bacteroidales bacterium]
MKESENKKVSIKDVAKAVGVSTTLVSLVINGKAKQYRIADEMAGRVMAKVKEMNYTPNLIARNLRGGKTQLIGLIVTDISNPFFSMISRVIENRANELNYTVIFGSSDEKYTNTQKLIDVLLNKGADGLIIVPCDGSEKIMERLHLNKTPTVLIDRCFKNLDISFSCLDNHRATVLATQHLIEQGFRKISLIAYQSQMSNVLDRISGYKDTMRKAGLEKQINVKQVSFSNTKSDVFGTVKRFIEKDKTEAILFSTNMLSIHGLTCLKEMNVKIPDDVAVVGFDESDVFDLYECPVSYIKQPVEQIAKTAVDILVDKIKNGESAKQSMAVLEPELIVKRSSLRNG